MKFLRIALVVLSAIILSAHFLRNGDLVLIIPSLVFPVLLSVRRTWAVRIVQVLLLLGATEWVRTTISYIQERQALGTSWDRLAMILGALVLLNIVAAVMLELPVRRRSAAAA